MANSLSILSQHILKFSELQTIWMGNKVSIYTYYFFLPIGCPNGITNITGSISTLVYPESGNYGVNETKCWRIKVLETSGYIIYRFSRYVSCVDALQ